MTNNKYGNSVKRFRWPEFEFGQQSSFEGVPKGHKY